ncbi:unnamed protein product [Blumeria hordei]|uniref:Uncharacterized protein n=1 Tax=Blumeria hordei TaxID=2867405 RepID=A0A383UTM3_BLUHO|nr:unnamed protein product [Blumeria hordei]
MSQAKLPEFVGLLQAEWVKPHITKKYTGGKENVSDKVTDLNITFVTCIDNYHQGFIDYMLLEVFQEDFVEWDSDSFAMVYPPILRRFKTFLMSRGIYVGCENNKRSTVAQQLAALLENDLHDLPQWPKHELDQMIRYGPEFQSLVFNEDIRSTVKVANNNNSDDTGTVSADLKSTKTGKNKYIPPKGEKEEETIYPTYPGDRCEDLYSKSDEYKKRPEQRQKARDGMEIDSDNDSGKTYIPKWAKETPTECINTSRALMDLSKLYVNPQDKFGARHYEVLENKLRIFFEKCRIAGIGENLFNDAFSTMLQDAAHNYYFRHLAEHLEDPNFDEIVHKVKRRFHTKTEEQNYLTEWRVLTLQKVIKDNPDKNTIQYLDLVIKKLQKML